MKAKHKANKTKKSRITSRQGKARHSKKSTVSAGKIGYTGGSEVNMENHMSALEVARQILLRFKNKGKFIDQLKLQKLLYYGQGFSLALLDSQLFLEPIKKMKHGPYVEKVGSEYTCYGASYILFDPFEEGCELKENLILDCLVTAFYDTNSFALVGRTHKEPPYVETQMIKYINIDKIKSFFKKVVSGETPESRLYSSFLRVWDIILLEEQMKIPGWHDEQMKDALIFKSEDIAAMC